MNHTLSRAASGFLALASVATAISIPAHAGEINAAVDVAWASRRDLTSSKFSDYFTTYRDRGYMITDVDAYPHGSGQRYAMIWRENPDGRGWAERRNLTSSQYYSWWQHYRDRGYRPLDVEAYETASGMRYAGIWIRNTEGLSWSSRRNMTSSQYSAYFQAQRGLGRRVVDIETYQTPSGIRYAGIWWENKAGLPWVQLRNMTRTSYQQHIDQKSAQGYRVVDFESVQTSSGQRYAAIWVKDGSGRVSAVRTNRTATQFANYWREYRDKGLRLIDFERYPTASGNRYAGVWVENKPSRYRWTNKAAVDSLITTYRSTNGLPGISVAIVEDGTMVYQRGFGLADIFAGKAAHSETVYLSASVSKVIGGTLAAKLEAEGQLADGTQVSLNLDTQTRQLLNSVQAGGNTFSMPAHHTHTVAQLLAHLGCVHHYSTGPEPPTQNYVTAGDAARRFWNTPLLNNCTVGSSRRYSTHAQTYVATVLEEVTGRPIDRLVREEIGERYGLGMRAMFETANVPSNYERAVPYNNAGFLNLPVSFADNSWKVLGGGIETSAAQLARFGWKVLNGEIVSASVRDNRLWQRVRPNRTNGLAWEIRTVNGRRVAEHGGSWTGARSHLRVYRDDGLVIAIMSNRRNHTVDDVNGLAGNIANVILN